jgi:hypothetical protein
MLSHVTSHHCIRPLTLREPRRLPALLRRGGARKKIHIVLDASGVYVQYYYWGGWELEEDWCSFGGDEDFQV